MAITKIHPIKSTLNLAIDYITREEKTDESIFVSSFKCHPKTAHIQFLKTRYEANTKGKVLAHHLIQSFVPGETTPEKAHEIGKALCDKIFKNEYEYVISTHVDKENIHNHIIFNNVNMRTAKCYQSNNKSYHKIRRISDELCKDNNLYVIDEYYEKFKKKYKTKGKSWYEYDKAKQGKSWKSRLAFDIDRAIRKVIDFDGFLKLMNEYGYEIKQGKHIAFKHKDKTRFTRAKTIGADYTEDRIKDRIEETKKNKVKFIKKSIGNVIDIKNNKKVQNSKGYEYWEKKHNLKTMSNSIIILKNLGINNLSELDIAIQKNADKRQQLQDEMKQIEKKTEYLSDTMEQIQVITKYREIYKYRKANPNDTSFENEYESELKLYKANANELLKNYDKMPNSKGIYEELEKLQEKKNTLLEEYSLSKSSMNELYSLRKNYETYMGMEVER